MTSVGGNNATQTINIYHNMCTTFTEPPGSSDCSILNIRCMYTAGMAGGVTLT